MKAIDKVLCGIKSMSQTKSFTFITILVLSSVFSSLKAEIKLPAIISSNMILQRNTDVVLWGWADNNEKITIEFSWLKNEINVIADNNGNWKFSVKTTNSKEAQTIRLKSNASNILLENILFGEVWLCSGQSNMEMGLKGPYKNGQPVFGANMAIAKSYNSNLHLFTAPRMPSKSPLKDVKNKTSWIIKSCSSDYGVWQEASPRSVADFSALAYFFGKQLQEILDVPVALIHSSWGGSNIQSWLSNEVINSFQKFDSASVNLNKKPNRIPTALFNGMIAPIIPYTIKGLLWYQGESNARIPLKYKIFFHAMVKDWRTRWDINFPVYYVQIAPYLYDKNNESFSSNKNSAFMREAQLQCLNLIPNSGIAITLDIGDAKSIHPPQKKKVADRLLFNALNKTYGYTAVDCEGPTYDSYEVKDGGILLKFKNVENGLYVKNGLNDFLIAGEDKVFYSAKAEIRKPNMVFVKSDKVPNPLAVRYAWRNYVVGTLYDTSLLPASSFRTDNWNDATLHKK